MPRDKLQTQQMVSFVRLDTIRDMTGIAKVMGLMQTDVKEMSKARTALDSTDESSQAAALMDISIYGDDAANKAEKLIHRVKDIRAKLESFKKQMK